MRSLLHAELSNRRDAVVSTSYCRFLSYCSAHGLNSSKTRLIATFENLAGMNRDQWRVFVDEYPHGDDGDDIHAYLEAHFRK